MEDCPLFLNEGGKESPKHCFGLPFPDFSQVIDVGALVVCFCAAATWLVGCGAASLSSLHTVKTSATIRTGSAQNTGRRHTLR